MCITHMEPSETGSSKWCLGLRFIWHLNERAIHSIQLPKDKDFEFAKETKCGIDNIMQSIMEDKGYLVM